MSRRLVAVLFTDLVGWTSLAERLDPEPLQRFLDGYYDICVAAVQQHGGMVEKFIGDAVMAVFGGERSREDDALRALRAAFRMREDVSRIVVAGSGGAKPAIHCGIAAGEAFVTHSVHAGVRIVGDVVNLAARLQSAAPTGEIYVNEVMAGLVRPHAAVAPMPALTLKGKREPVPVWRAVALTEGVPRESFRAPLVDREQERDHLLSAYRDATRAERARAVLLVGPPGIGKTRLARAAVEWFQRADSRTMVAVGRSTSLGEPNGYAPIREMLDTLLGDDELVRRVSGIRGGRLLEVLSYLHRPVHAAGAATGPGLEEVSWAMRELLGHLAPRLTVLVWEDLQWAGPAVLDIVADLVTSLRDQPVLSICVSRQELPELPADDRTLWSLLELTPLPRQDTTSLVNRLMAAAEPAEVMAQSADALDRVVDDCAGNPLYAELMVETIALGHAVGDVPPSIVALIGATVDRLPHEGATLLEMASVVGTEFTLDQLATLGGDPAAPVIEELLRRQMVVAGARPGAYRFAQHLAHGVVYGRLDKQQRLDWHRRLAEQDVNPALHLDAVVRLLRDLRPDDPDLPEAAARAASVLLAEGTLALRRRNLPAALDLLRRAHELPLAGDAALRAMVAIRRSDALFLAGDLTAAQAAVEPRPDCPPPARAGRACRIHRALLAIRTGEPAGVSVEELAADLRQDEDDHLSWSRLQQLRMLLQMSEGRFLDAERSALSALRHAEAMADGYECDRLRAAICEVGQWSPTPIPDKLAFCADVAARFADDRCLLVPVLVVQARLLALVGELERARAALAQAGRAVTDLRLTMAAVLVDQGAGTVASLAGEHRAAEEHLRSAARVLDATGHRPAALTVRALALRERLRWRHDEQAEEEVRGLSGEVDRMDLRGRIISAAAAVCAAARPGRRIDEAAEQVRAQLDRVDDACLRGDTLADLAAAQARCGDDADARATARAAAEVYAAIGAALPLRRVQQWM